jgi:hypothetical protein
VPNIGSSGFTWERKTSVPRNSILTATGLLMEGDSLDSSNGRLIEAFDNEGGDFIKRGTVVLQSIIRCPVCRAEYLTTSLALVATMLPPSGLVKAMTNDGSTSPFPEGGQCY